MIYDLKYNDFSKLMKDFGKTIYGKAMFLICYTPFLIGLVFSIIALIFSIKEAYFLSTIAILKLFLGTLFLLCIGSYGFYNQLRLFADEQKKK